MMLHDDGDDVDDDDDYGDGVDPDYGGVDFDIKSKTTTINSLLADMNEELIEEYFINQN